MAIHTITSNIATAGNAYSIASNDVLFINAGVVVESTTTADVIAANTAEDAQIFVAGTVVGQGDGIYLDHRSLVNISATGSFVSGDEAVTSNGFGAHILNNGSIFGDTTGVDFLALASENSLTNSGSILSGGDAINVAAARLSITNTGNITGYTGGIDSSFGFTLSNEGTISSSDGHAIRSTSSSTDIYNSGSIVSELEAVQLSGGFHQFTNSGRVSSDVRDGVVISGTGGGNFVTNTGDIIAEDHGIHIADGSNSQVYNSGMIVSRSATGIILSGASGSRALINDGTILAENEGLSISGQNYHVINNGTISSLGEEAVQLGSSSGSVSSFSNHGLLVTSSANGIALRGSAVADATDSILNTGSIEGHVILQNGGDDLINSGLVRGDVDMGEGDDLYQGGGNSNVTGIILGGEGNDTLFGGQNDDFIEGEDDNDVIRGRDGEDNLLGGLGSDKIRGGEGDDVIEGNEGADNIRGGSGDDVITGGKGDDVLRGKSGDDVLEGNNGDDAIRGGDGDDMIIGGGGTDLLIGNGGMDVFVFNNISESTNNAARDEIRFFEDGDMIDLQNVFGGTLEFIGTGAFTGTDNEVRIKEGAAGNTTVYVDTNGDGSGDMRIFVSDTLGMTESDFIL
ncbi:hypothetical protein [Planktotalea sp.]|uniref:hypothetical protein n=1 Tax=Planktotalea sp. TaxID=2029877 RepID=UPI003D6AF137